MWNAVSLVQELNPYRRVHILWTITITPRGGDGDGGGGSGGDSCTDDGDSGDKVVTFITGSSDEVLVLEFWREWSTAS